ncbi:MAG TPA: DUF2142 domain-containing protein [Acidimicrobiia bacterium]|nr:DUF2142 domain-containing protein [Acidimicrobiia bacterium]
MVVTSLTRLRQAVGRHPGRSAFVAFFALAMLWSVITPLFGAPDEPAHAIRAESLVRGEILGTKVHGTGDLQVTAPAFLSASVRDACFAFRAVVPASCMNLGGSFHGDRHMLTSAGRAPPAYYAIVGLPSLLAANLTGVWLMRLLSALLCAALVGLAVDTARRYLAGTVAMFGVAVAVTPMLFFLAGALNPSGIEIAAAVAAWVAGVALVTRAPEVDPRLVDRLGIAAGVLLIARQLGPVWVAVIAVVLLVLGGASIAQRLWRVGRARAWIAGLAVLAVAQLAWNFGTGALNTENTNTVGTTLGLLDRIRDSFGVQYTRFLEMIGLFGWRDTPAPTGTYLLWILALGGLVLGLFLLASRRGLLAAGLLTAAVIVVPILFEVPAAPKDGFFWQGRYTLTMAVGIPILAAALIRPGPGWRLRRASALTAGALGLGLLLAFFQFWRRNAVGTHGVIFFFNHAAWHPPVPAWFLVPAVVVFTSVWVWLLLLAPGPSNEPESPTPEGATTPAAAVTA